MVAEDKAAFSVAIGAMLETFGVESTKAILLGYWLGLNDLELHQVEAAVSSAIRNCKFTPKPFELRELIGVAGETRAQNAWLDVQKAFSVGAYKSIDFEDKLCNATIRALGGWPDFVEKAGSAKDIEFLRKAFFTTYKNFANSSVSGEACKPLQGISQVTIIGGEIKGPTRIGCDAERAKLPCPVKSIAADVKRIEVNVCS